MAIQFLGLVVADRQQINSRQSTAILHSAMALQLSVLIIETKMQRAIITYGCLVFTRMLYKDADITW